MDQTFSNFPENFRIVDDACGQSSKARRQGKQPIIDVRYLTKYSALRRWGARQLDVEVVFSDGRKFTHSLRPWLVAERWQYYRDGKSSPQNPSTSWIPQLHHNFCVVFVLA